MLEFTFRPRVVSIRAGTIVRLVLRNRGQVAHQFETDYLRRIAVQVQGDVLYIEAPGLDIARVNPGGTAWLMFLPRRSGRFVFACTIEGHREAGMQGILEVR